MTASSTRSPARLVATFAWLVFAVRLVAFDGLEIVRGHGYNDYASFHFAALAIRDGKSPYDPAVLAELTRELHVPLANPYVYPPLLAELLLPSSFLEPWIARLLFWAASVAAIGFAAYALDRWLARDGEVESSNARALLAVAMAMFWPVHDSAMMGQVNAIVLALLVAWWTNRLRSDRAAIFLGVAIALKMSPGVLVLLPLLRRRWRETAIACGVGGGLIALSCLVLGARGLGFVRDVFPTFLPGRPWHALRVPIDLIGNDSLAAFAFALTRPHADVYRLEGAAVVVQIVALVAMLGALVVRARSISDEAATAALLVLMLVTPTYCYEHHLVFALLAIALLGKLAADGRMSSKAAIALALAYAIVAAPIQQIFVPASVVGVKLEPFLRFPKLLPMLVAFGVALASRRERLARVVEALMEG